MVIHHAPWQQKRAFLALLSLENALFVSIGDQYTKYSLKNEKNCMKFLLNICFRMYAYTYKTVL